MIVKVGTFVFSLPLSQFDLSSMASAAGTCRLGVDVGGKFTDACALSSNGKIFRAKVPSTRHDQSIGVKSSIDKVR